MPDIDINDSELIQKIDWVDAREREHFAKAQLGEQVKEFLLSPVGRYLHGRAKQDLEECRELALECNPDSLFGRRKLRRLKRKAGVANNFIQWCVDAITEGEISYRELQEYDQYRRG